MQRSDNGPIDVSQLQGVAATAVWMLRSRAMEASRSDGVLRDPVAVELLSRLRFEVGSAIGEPDQSHALRAACFDAAVRRFLATHPDGTVVGLGDGMETGFWRTDNGRVRWLSVDLPEIVELRERLLPADPRARHLARSALDRAWMDEVDTTRPVLVTAQGLLSYLQPADALALVSDCAARFPGGQMIFNCIPPWYRWWSRRSGQGVTRPFALTASQIRRTCAAMPGVVAVHPQRPPAGRGWKKRAVEWVGRLPVLRNHRHSIVLLEFAPRP